MRKRESEKGGEKTMDGQGREKWTNSVFLISCPHQASQETGNWVGLVALKRKKENEGIMSSGLHLTKKQDQESRTTEEEIHPALHAAAIEVEIEIQVQV